MTQIADIVVAGGGHNSLITAAYLAKAGHECLVLDARAIPGGGAATEELLGPGYRIDSCSTGHTIIRVNPLLMNDELGLHADYGLEYLEPDPVAHVAFPDGEQLTMWLDLDRTCDEIARFSRTDAEAYRRLIGEYDEVKGIFGRARVTPPGFGPSLEEMLLEHPRGRIWLRRNSLSAWDVIRREFQDRHIQAFMIWQAFQTLVPVDAAGSGVNAYSIIFGRQGRSWSVPRGGSGALTEALTHFLEDHGSTVLCNRQVSRLVLDDGRCTGVETDDGERYMARRAVLSTIHVKHLVEMAPREVWGEEFLYGVDTYDVGMSGMACYLATDAAPEFQTPDGSRAAVSAGTVGWPEDVLALGRAVRDRRPFDEGVPWLLVATPTLVDARARARGPSHREAAEPADLGSTGGCGELGGPQGDDLPTTARARASLRSRALGRAHPHLLREEPGGHRAFEPAHGPRCLPRRRSQLRVQREEPTGAGMGGSPHADSRAVPNGRNNERGRLGHRRARPERGNRDAERPRR